MSNNNNSGGIGFCGLLTIVFITLKLTGFINWSWFLILAPVYVPLAIILGVLLVIVALGGTFRRIK